MRKIIILSLICLFLTPQLTLPAETIYVGPTRTHTTIQAGIDAAADGDTVIVDPGTYTGPGNRDIEITGKSITIRSDTGPESCIIDCQGTETEPHRGFNFSNNMDINAVIDGFTIINACVIEMGAGIDCRQNQNSPLTISNCSISNNSSFGRGTGSGGGISITDGIYAIYNCTISNNSANNDGGAIYSENSNTDIKNCTIKNNSSWRGGGFYCSNSSATVQNCTFTDNSATTGSAMYNYSSESILTNSILWGNSPSQISNSSQSTLTVSYCCIQNWTGGGTGNFPDDPLLAPDGCHLLPGSPCINAGDLSADYTGQTDIDGQPRVMAGRVDIGADEVFYQSATLRVPADYSTIQAAIDAASDGDIVLIADDTYTGDGNRDLDFHGKAITVKSENGYENCTIDCQATVDDRHRGFCFHNGEYQNSVLDGLTIINGFAPRSIPEGSIGGGAILCYNASPTIKNCYLSGNTYHAISCDEASPKIDSCIITENTCSSGGGIGCPSNGSPLIINCTITKNTANHGGGGIYCCLYSNPSIIDCNISDNSADGSGGAVYCMHDSYPTIINSTITGNYAGYGGGGLAGSGAPLNPSFIPVVTNCIISNNTAQNGPGGGLSGWYGHIKNCIISGNTSYYGGGGLASCSGSITDCNITGNTTSGHGGGLANCNGPITNCTISGNTSVYYGGGLSECDNIIDNCAISNNTSLSEGGGLHYCSGDIVNCIITGNKSYRSGGGLSFCNGPITKCIISGNVAEESGGGLDACSGDIRSCIIAGNKAYREGALSDCDALFNCTLTGNWAHEYSVTYHVNSLTNCIFWDNSVESHIQCYATYSCFQNIDMSFCQVNDNIEADPLFISPGYWVDANHPGIVVEPNDPNAVWIDGDYHLFPHSPCINAGDPAYTPGPDETDIDGHPRVSDGRVDIGADEYFYIPGTLIALDIVGPNYVMQNRPQQYAAITTNEYGSKKDVTASAVWSIYPQTHATVTQDGLLTITNIETSQDVTLYAQYTSRDNITLEAQLDVRLFPPNKLRVPAEYDTIQAAIDAAEYGEVVLVADDTYTGPGNYNLDFHGKAITVESENGPENCIIDCNFEAAGFFFRNEEQNNSVLDGFTITHAGSSPYPDPGPWLPGPDPIYFPVGAIRCFGSNPIIKNCIITRNFYGRGITCTGGSPIIANCVISDNSYYFSSAELGGGIYCSDSSPTITNCTITNNRAFSPDPDKGLGGGIYCRNSSPTITNCTISYNTAYSSYHGPYIPPGGGSPDVYGFGGGIYCAQSDVTISNCTIIGNNARADGGAIATWSSSATVTNSVIWNNSMSQIAGQVTAAYSNIEGGWQGEGNINIDPLLTWDGHLQAASPCINAGDPCYVPAPDETDIDGESRISYGRLDMGSDEFADSDSDGLPDWWELKYFADPNIAHPADDPDTDQWPNIDEYSNSTEPNVIPVVYYVNSYNNPGSSPTQSLNSQYITKDNIQDAVAACRTRHNDIVMLAPGTYTGYYNMNIDFYGKAITICSTDPQNPCVVAATIIDCQHIYRTRAFNLHSNEGRASLISGITIANGNAYYPPSPPSPIPPPYEPPIWDNNEPLPYYYDPDPSIIMGGAISCENASPTIRNCLLIANNAQTYGGAIYCYNAAPEISDCIINDNSSMEGAAIYCNGNSSPEIKNCEINYNSAKYSGGAIHSEQSCLTILNSTIMQNSAVNPAGGIYYKDSNSVITNCVISGNSSKIGGGIFCWDSSPILKNCAIIGNLAFGKLVNLYSGGGIFSGVGGNPVLTNCILWDNAPEQVCLASTGTPTITYSNIQDGWPGWGNIDLPPSFVDPGFWDTNDTPADANDDLWIDGDYYLLPDSPCIDTGDPNYISQPNETDLDGSPRVVNGRIDMGTYETDYLCARLWFAPRTINRQNRLKRVMAWMLPPKGITRDQIDQTAPLLLYPGSLEPVKQYIFEHGRPGSKHTSIFLLYDKAELMAAVPDNGRVDVQVIGSLNTSQQFYGNSFITIRDRPRPRIRRWRRNK